MPVLNCSKLDLNSLGCGITDCEFDSIPLLDELEPPTCRKLRRLIYIVAKQDTYINTAIRRYMALVYCFFSKRSYTYTSDKPITVAIRGSTYIFDKYSRNIFTREDKFINLLYKDSKK